MPMSTNALGKAILAYLLDDRIKSVLDEQGLPKITNHTLTSRNDLYDQLDQIRKQRYVTDYSQLRVSGLAPGPIIAEDAVRGALVISGPVNRMERERFETDLPDLLLQLANVVEVQYTLGE